MTVICDYCGKPAELWMSSDRIHNGRDYGPVWICVNCQAWVGVHTNSTTMKPLGRLANAELRKAKIAAHAAFDPIWKERVARVKRVIDRQKIRNDAYSWLSRQLGIAVKDCHIGAMDIETCRRVVEVCAGRKGNDGKRLEKTD